VYRSLIAMLSFFAVVVLAAGVFVFSTLGPKDEVKVPVNPDDPVLTQVRALNPNLRIEKRLREDFNRIPLYWVIEPKNGRSVILPRSMAEENAVVEFLPCVPRAIPPRLRYPHATKPVCLRITNDVYRREAVYFETSDRMRKLIIFYDGSVNEGNRLRMFEENWREGRRPDGSRGFLYSYAIYETARKGGGWQTFALVSYKRESK
jgi:hypothetical protein